ncbi:MAG: 16S rRNA (guanine(527)-N(7))-methyltransferase RsmG [Candidatus Limnocylindrales bacterium]
MPETSRRRERGQRNGSGTFGHGRNPDRPSLPRRFPSLPESVDGLPELAPEFWSVVDEGIATLVLELTPGQRAAIDAHARLLLAWNEQINLTALRTPEQIARSHVLDSLLAVPAIRILTRGRATSVLDIGSGGGFPGLPLAAVLPAHRAVLVDSIGKKARFLNVAARAVAGLLGGAGSAGSAVEITALAERAEDLADAPDQRERWDVVAARAVGTVAELAEIGLPLARVRGHVVIWKRDAGDGLLAREVADARRIAQACGGGAPRIVTLTAAEQVGLEGHCLVVIEKRRATPDRYPRQPGERRRAPLN